MEKYLIKGSNPVIISEEEFNKVQLEKKYRRTAKIKNSQIINIKIGEEVLRKWLKVKNIKQL